MDNQLFNDFLIPISWPDQTARGDEKWMAFFARIGIVKNLNFRVGHAAILLIERESGQIKYYDFGRYLVPRGYGRARSARFDPRLVIETKAAFDRGGDICNLQEILDELHAKEEATHGGGRTLFSICRGVSYQQAEAYADELVAQGPILYGALAKKNNSCSRFVAQVLTAAMPTYDTRRRKILYPESLKASPTSNVVNAAVIDDIFCYFERKITAMPMHRIASLRFQVGLLKDNFSRSGAEKLGCDQVPGMMQYVERPLSVPINAQWIGGIGEGAWFTLALVENSTYQVKRYDADGILLYEQIMASDDDFSPSEDFEFTHHFSFEKHYITQRGKQFVLQAIDFEQDFLHQKNSEQAII
ncbi:DUF6695 family protein [Sphingobacterium corticibacter]|uniref:Uncharacterized protein n=1 Tax=Sphingobacterium corticibacter TaxID=2171749 RepID=A0A2T8HNH5_9SPHI|nr:DUF6695 family protein [Sphingobacterium corticibacter]PVH26960.1 hypothetical protein DC487_05035 [Sphingobacterium corticibacter]